MSEHESAYVACDPNSVAAEHSSSPRPSTASLLVAQCSLAVQRRGRYFAGLAAHPDRMAPDLAAAMIGDYTRPGDLVFDPLA
jgi:hypothetical protein